MQLRSTDSADMTAREIFQIIIEFMQGAYPKRNIKLNHTPYGAIVEIDGEQKFNIEGYCLLYNLQCLAKCLEGELL